MFYFIVSKLQIITGSNDDSKVYKIFILGSICYIILHTLLFSNIGENIELVTTYRNYIYYMWVIDCLITGIIVKLFGSHNNDDDDDNDDESSGYNKISKKLAN